MKKSIMTLGTVAMLIGSVALAKSGLNTVTKSLQGDVVIAAQEQRAINACSAVTTKIAGRINNFNTNRNKHVDNYISAKEKITDLLTKLEAKGYDVSKVRTDLVQYDALLKTFSGSYSVYISDLTATQNYACGKSEGEFRAQLQAARAQLVAVRTADRAVKDYFRQIIKPDMQALRSQIKPKVTDDTNTLKTTSTTGGTE